MKKKKYTKEEMMEVLNKLSSHLSDHTGEFPGVVNAVLALSEAAKDPTKGMAKKEAKARPIKPVKVTYKGDSILVQTPWGRAGKALGDAFKMLVGKRGKSINPETGELYILSCYSKKDKAFKVPMAKKEQVLKAIAESGLPVAG